MKKVTSEFLSLIGLQHAKKAHDRDRRDRCRNSKACRPNDSFIRVIVNLRWIRIRRGPGEMERLSVFLRRFVLLKLDQGFGVNTNDWFGRWRSFDGLNRDTALGYGCGTLVFRTPSGTPPWTLFSSDLSGASLDLAYLCQLRFQRRDGAM